MTTTPDFRGQIPTDADGFYGYVHGGGVNVKFAAFAYSDGTADAFTLPKGAEIVGWITNITTAFDGTGSNVIDVGDATTDNRFANDLSMASAAQLVTGYDPDELFTPLTKDTLVQISYRGAAANAGALTLGAFYIMR